MTVMDKGKDRSREIETLQKSWRQEIMAYREERSKKVRE